MKILIINGPNLNLLGTREKGIYGNQTFEEYLDTLSTNAEISYFQSNIEGEIINALQEASEDGIILNAGGYTHSTLR